MRIKDLPFGTSVHSSCMRYEGAYRFFVADAGVTGLMRSMHAIGNALAVAELMDEALAMKQFSSTQALGYVRGVDKKGTPRDEIEGLFDHNFTDAIQIVTARPMTIPENAHQLLMSIAMTTFIHRFEKEAHAFEEPNPKADGFTSMSGFACVWSVVEFMYCVMEALRVGDLVAGFVE